MKQSKEQVVGYFLRKTADVQTTTRTISEKLEAEKVSRQHFPQPLVIIFGAEELNSFRH